MIYTILYENIVSNKEPKEMLMLNYNFKLLYFSLWIFFSSSNHLLQLYCGTILLLYLIQYIFSLKT